MNVLVDTSVWIRFFAGTLESADALRTLLVEERVVGHELIYGELLIGDKGGRESALNSYQQIRQTQPVPHSEVIAFVRKRTLHGRGIGWIDVHLLASAVVAGCRLWTQDSRLAELALSLGVGYTPHK